MCAPVPPGPRSALVTRLRAAGCVFAEDEADLLLTAAGSADELMAMVERRTAVAAHPPAARTGVRWPVRSRAIRAALTAGYHPQRLLTSALEVRHAVGVEGHPPAPGVTAGTASRPGDTNVQG